MKQSQSKCEGLTVRSKSSDRAEMTYMKPVIKQNADNGKVARDGSTSSIIYALKLSKLDHGAPVL